MRPKKELVEHLLRLVDQRKICVFNIVHSISSLTLGHKRERAKHLKLKREKSAFETGESLKCELLPVTEERSNSIRVRGKNQLKIKIKTLDL